MRGDEAGKREGRNEAGKAADQLMYRGDGIYECFNCGALIESPLSKPIVTTGTFEGRPNQMLVQVEGRLVHRCLLFTPDAELQQES
jgi:hypothetical protein